MFDCRAEAIDATGVGNLRHIICSETSVSDASSVEFGSGFFSALSQVSTCRNWYDADVCSRVMV